MDLKWLLVRRISLVALTCFIAGSTMVLFVTARDAQQQNEDLAELASRQLNLQLSRIERGTDISKRFPDWDIVSNYALEPGQCIKFRGADPARNRSNCSGIQAGSAKAPTWFAKAYRNIIDSHLSVSRSLTYRGSAQGVISVSFDPEATSSRAWATISPLLGMSAILVAALCFVTYFVVDRSLRPADDILNGLNKLAEGDLKVRLPPFQLAELNRISQVFNAVTKELERATAERTELAHRLVDMQEQERRHLARELHDEIAQKLVAICALSACVRDSARSGAPQLVDEAREIEEIASNLIVSLRQTLSYLRPQEIDDLGLVQSLKALVDRHNERARGRTVFLIRAADELEGLQPETSAHVYRIVQEALTNASKHASAKTVTICLTEHVDSVRKHVRLSVIDDGIGQPLDVNSDRLSGSGLIGISERVMALSGTFSAGPLPTGGFGLHVEFPSSAQRA